jgi:hypothetical protein
MKTCFKCGGTKPFADFYKHPAMGDGYLGKCKACAKADVAARVERKKVDPMWVMAERARCRDKARRERANGIKRFYPGLQKRWQKNHPLKRRAHNIANEAVRSGKLVSPGNCRDCGSPGPLQKHHPDYSQPLLIEWLCTGCHGKRHRKAA